MPELTRRLTPRVRALASDASDGVINIGFGAGASFEGDFERLLVELGYN